MLALLALYAALTAAGLPLALLIWGFGALVALATAAITALHRRHTSQGARRAPLPNATPENA